MKSVYNLRIGFLLFKRLFLQTYHPTFLAANYTDARASVMIYGLLTGVTSLLPLIFITTLIKDEETIFSIAVLRVLCILISLIAFCFAKFRVRFFERHLFSNMVFFIFSLVLLHIPMMIFDSLNHSFYLYSSALAITSASIILWIEPIRVIMFSVVHFVLFLPLNLMLSKSLKLDSYEVSQNFFMVLFLLFAGFIANLLINFWRFEEYRHKIRLRVTVGKLLKTNQKIQELSRIDSMTELYNRRHLLEQFELYKKRAKRENLNIGLVILDLDRLKMINDKHGHKQGDLSIQAFAKTLKSRVRATDIAARIGGDEFCILASPIDESGLVTLTESIREKMETLKIPMFHSDGNFVQMTVSIGGSLFPASEDPSFDELYHKIDEALYKSKHEGRNRVTIVK